ncbi:MAG: NAD-dependent epimerase/dehydratase family protein [Solobacterium sp.]|nr:NAD-dependent epimerase/dehydratase family protein [Solobacterium sp.]
MNRMRVIILGAGYLGTNLYSLLKDRYETELWGIDSPYVPLLDTFTEVDAFDPAAMAKENLKDAVVIDAIGLVANSAKAEDEEKELHRIEAMYRRLMNSLKAGGAEKIVFFSSGGTIYGNTERPISETDPVKPASLYARSKYLSEEIIRNCGMDYLILRLSNPYGGYQIAGKKQGVIPILIRKVLIGEVFEMWASAQSVRDYFYITDLAAAIEGLLEREISNEIINVGSGTGTSLQEIISMIEAETGKHVKIELRKSEVPVVESIVLDVSKLKRLTGWQPAVTLNQGIRLETERILEEI